jgi:hypothetical protein
MAASKIDPASPSITLSTATAESHSIHHSNSKLQLHCPLARESRIIENRNRESVTAGMVVMAIAVRMRIFGRETG